MDQQQFSLPREEIIFQRMKNFHLQRVSAVASGDVPLQQRDGGILVLHLIPESCVFSHGSMDGAALKEHGCRIRPLGNHGGNIRFNVDGFLNQSGYQEVLAYSQLFRDGRLESAMSDVGYPVNQHVENSPHAIRHGLVEHSVFGVVGDYLQFCKAVEFEPSVWLFSALVDCQGFRMATGRFRDLSGSVDRSPAILPEFEIADFETAPQHLLHPWCDYLWQATGLERSLNYDDEGNWHEPR